MTDEHYANGQRIIRKENRHGAMKSYVEVPVGTARVVVPRYIRNPSTGCREDLTRLSDDGYLKHYLALYWNFTERKSGVVNLDHAPVLSFWREKWRTIEKENYVVHVKREPSSRFEEMVLGARDD